MAVDWMNLPESLWMNILQQMDVKTLLKTSETCKMFNNLVENTILMEKLKLVFVMTPYIKKDLVKATKEYIKVFERSTRNYKTIEFDFLVKSIFCDSPLPPFYYPAATGKSIQITKLFSHSVREVNFTNYHGSARDCKTLFKSDPKFQIQYFTVNMEPKEEYDNFPYYDIVELFDMSPFCEELCMNNVNNDSQMGHFNGLIIKGLELSGPFSSQYEQLLLKQDELIRLTSDATQMFENDNLSKVKFSVIFMNLFNAKWTNKQNALNFIKTQMSLKFVKIRLDKDQYDIEFLKHIINTNQDVITVSVELEGCDAIFMKEIHQLQENSFVRYASFTCVPENPSLSEMFMRLFPCQVDLSHMHLFD